MGVGGEARVRPAGATPLRRGGGRNARGVLFACGHIGVHSRHEEEGAVYHFGGLGRVCPPGELGLAEPVSAPAGRSSGDAAD